MARSAPGSSPNRNRRAAWAGAATRATPMGRVINPPVVAASRPARASASIRSAFHTERASHRDSMPASGSPNGTPVAASAQIHNASARLAARRAPGLDEQQKRRLGGSGASGAYARPLRVGAPDRRQLEHRDQATRRLHTARVAAARTSIPPLASTTTPRPMPIGARHWCAAAPRASQQRALAALPRNANCRVSSNRAVSASWSGTLESTAFVEEQPSRPALLLVVRLRQRRARRSARSQSDRRSSALDDVRARWSECRVARGLARRPIARG